jgi:hypothetical protein
MSRHFRRHQKAFLCTKGAKRRLKRRDIFVEKLGHRLSYYSNKVAIYGICTKRIRSIETKMCHIFAMYVGHVQCIFAKQEAYLKS